MYPVKFLASHYYFPKEKLGFSPLGFRELGFRLFTFVTDLICNNVFDMFLVHGKHSNFIF